MTTLHNWFEVHVQYDKIGTNDDKQKKVTDIYLIDALSFSEAEARAIETVRPYMSGEFTISNIKRARIYEIFDAPDGDIWFRAKVNFVVLDQEKGTEKKIPATMLVQAEDLKQARERLEDGMKDTLSDYQIAMITETKILDIVPYDGAGRTEKEEEAES